MEYEETAPKIVLKVFTPAGFSEAFEPYEAPPNSVVRVAGLSVRFNSEQKSQTVAGLEQLCQSLLRREPPFHLIVNTVDYLTEIALDWKWIGPQDPDSIALSGPAKQVLGWFRVVRLFDPSPALFMQVLEACRDSDILDLLEISWEVAEGYLETQYSDFSAALRCFIDPMRPKRVQLCLAPPSFPVSRHLRDEAADDLLNALEAHTAKCRLDDRSVPLRLYFRKLESTEHVHKPFALEPHNERLSNLYQDADYIEFQRKAREHVPERLAQTLLYCEAICMVLPLQAVALLARVLGLEQKTIDELVAAQACNNAFLGDLLQALKEIPSSDGEEHVFVDLCKKKLCEQLKANVPSAVDAFDTAGSPPVVRHEQNVEDVLKAVELAACTGELVPCKAELTFCYKFLSDALWHQVFSMTSDEEITAFVDRLRREREENSLVAPFLRMWLTTFTATRDLRSALSAGRDQSASFNCAFFNWPHSPSLMQCRLAQEVFESIDGKPNTGLHHFANWSKPGTGKTVGALLAAMRSNSQLVVIVGPVPVIRNSDIGWQAEIRAVYGSHGEMRTFVNILDDEDSNLIPQKTNFLLVPYSWLQRNEPTEVENKLLRRLNTLGRISGPVFLVLDEIQCLKDPNAIRTKNAISLQTVLQKWTAANGQKLTEPGKQFDRKWSCSLVVLALSATPFKNSCDEAGNLLKLLGRDQIELSRYTEFEKQFFLHKDYSLIPSLRSSLTLKHKLNVEVKNIPQGEKMEKFEGVVDRELCLTKMKLEAITEKVKTAFLSGSKVLIYTQYKGETESSEPEDGNGRPIPASDEIINCLENAVREALAASHQAYKPSWVGHFTGTSSTKSDKAFKSFMNQFNSGSDDCHVLIGTSSLGTGVDGLQRACSTVIFNILPFTSADYEQIIGRIYRTGQTQNVNVFIPLVVFPDGSWCRKAYARILRKERLLASVLDGECVKLETGTGASHHDSGDHNSPDKRKRRAIRAKIKALRAEMDRMAPPKHFYLMKHGPLENCDFVRLPEREKELIRRKNYIIVMFGVSETVERRTRGEYERPWKLVNRKSDTSTSEQELMFYTHEELTNIFKETNSVLTPVAHIQEKPAQFLERTLKSLFRFAARRTTTSEAFLETLNHYGFSCFYHPALIDLHLPGWTESMLVRRDVLEKLWQRDCTQIDAILECRSKLLNCEPKRPQKESAWHNDNRCNTGQAENLSKDGDDSSMDEAEDADEEDEAHEEREMDIDDNPSERNVRPRSNSYP